MCAVLLFLAGCGSSATRVEDLNSTIVTLPGGRKIMAETMRTEADMARGMMFRDALPKDRGMLFVHTTEGKYPYWMFNCKVPLDIIWMNRNRQVVEISLNTPPCPSTDPDACPTYGGHQNAQYVLELNGGASIAYGIAAGSQLSF
jgi:uncharacterized membrane protein (UPF0127 family)